MRVRRSCRRARGGEGARRVFEAARRQDGPQRAEIERPRRGGVGLRVAAEAHRRDTRQRRDALPIIRAFEAVGATLPVELDTNGKALLIEALGSWIDRIGERELPAGVAELRAALLEDLDAAGYWRE